MVTDAFSADLAEHKAALKRYAYRLVRSTDADGDDLLQDTLLRCWRARNSFIPGSNFAAWARTVMRNHFLSGRRRARYDTEFSDETWYRALSIVPTQELAIALKDVSWAIGQLTDEHREAVLFASAGASGEEGAMAFSIPEATFKSRLCRGRLRLRELIDHREAFRSRDSSQ